MSGIGRSGHDYVHMFTTLSAESQQDIASRVRLVRDFRQATPGDMVEVLKQFDGTFVKFRYVHEELQKHGRVAFHHGDISNVLQAVHDSIIALRPDLGPWNGVIYDGQDTTSSARTLDRMTAPYRRALGVP